MFIPNFIVKCLRHLEKNYFFSSELSFLVSDLTSFLVSTLVSFGKSFSSVLFSITSACNTSDLVSTISIPIFFLIFSAILADLPFLSLK